MRLLKEEMFDMEVEKNIWAYIGIRNTPYIVEMSTKFYGLKRVLLDCSFIRLVETPAAF